MGNTPEERNHQEWIGYVQPVGLVVSTPALLNAQCQINRNIASEHVRFVSQLPLEGEERVNEIPCFRSFVTEVFGWRDDDVRQLPENELPEEFSELEVVLPEYNETLKPTYVVPEDKPAEDENPWMMLVKELPAGQPLDDVHESDSRRWQASPHAKFERLLRETEIPIGLLFNGNSIRLIYAPRGETSGYLTFKVQQMATVAGRSIFAAMFMLFSEERLFSLRKEHRLPAILAASRKHQNTVSTELAEQVLAALYELMRGFQAANDATHGELLKKQLASDPNHVYAGLLTVLMRTVFILYAEDRDLLSSDPVYSNYYSITGLFERLRSDAGRFPDTMHQRHGAWSQLLTLFRLIYNGGKHREFKIPPRKGYLFDPDRYLFLEGRSTTDDPPSVPRISDGVVFHVLNNLLVLNGERLSYRTLDVEQIGSVYETVMGFNLEVAAGKSIAIKPIKKHGAPATINLEALLDTPPKDRAKWLKEQSDQKLTGAALKELKAATNIQELLEALDKKIAKKITPHIVPQGAIVLQPSDERRRSGSHYTPRSLTEPIVRTTLEPILKPLRDSEVELPGVFEPTKEDKKRYTKGEIAKRVQQSERNIEYAELARKVGAPHPSQILEFKICDPAMGSGAFLVETCRQLGDELIKAWHAHDLAPTDIPPDEDEVLYARRIIAQRCLYGVDKNDMAVDLAKLSLWLVTLAQDHPFTFLDHSLRHGDSLVGLSRKQIIGFHWEPKKQKQFGEDLIQKRLDRATEARAKILNAREDTPYRDQEQRLALADAALDVVRLTGDACVSAFFAGSKKKEREENCEGLFACISDWYASGHDTGKRAPVAAAAASLRSGEHTIPPFHWEIEFPEVFSRENGGFDAFVGNPPFAGKNTLINGNRDGYLDWLSEAHVESHGNADLVARFFRRGFSLTRMNGATGLIATNTIQQGDTRDTGLRFICKNDGTIYCARRRQRWPGEAAVMVSVVHIFKGPYSGTCLLDGREVKQITAYLVSTGGHDNPNKLRANDETCFQGSIVLGIGFTFDDDDSTGLANTLEKGRELSKSPRNAELIKPYINGAEVNERPRHTPDRLIIDFFDRSLEECQNRWPELLQIVRDSVKPDRDKQKRKAIRERWWQYAEKRPGLYRAVRDLERVIVRSLTSKHFAFTFLPNGMIYDQTLVVVARDSFSVWSVISCRVHQTWADFFGATLEDRPRYNIADCFETYPFPQGDLRTLDEVGKAAFDHRSNVMIENDEGLTATYNRFHDPHEQSSEILQLRELHAAMDQAVLEAYGWDDLAQTARCEFLLDYQEEEDDEPGAKKSKKKKPWRLRWPDEFRDEVLARLLELNEQRHKQELLAGNAGKPKRKTKTRQAPKKAETDERQQGLF